MLLEPRRYRRSRALRLGPCVLLGAAVVLLGGCYKTRHATVEVHGSISGRTFNVFGIIGSENTRFVGNVTTRIRMRLEKAGFTFARTQGTFDTEQDAMARACETGSADGVIFAKWDEVILRSCTSGYPRVFQAEGGGAVGVDEMIKGLLEYLGPRETAKGNTTRP